MQNAGKIILKRHVSSLAMLASGLVMVVVAIQAPSAQPAPAGEGQALFEQICTGCHTIGLATSERHDADGWREVVQRMVGFGASLDEQQANGIVDYLAGNFAPAAERSTAQGLPAPTSTEARYPRPQGPDQWPSSGGGGANQNFARLDQITPRNVARLQPAWVYHYGAGRTSEGDQGLDYRFEITPLLIGGLMYISTPMHPLKPDLKASVTALDPVSGKVVWKYESPWNIHGRGLAYWPGDSETAPRLIFGTDGGMLVAVDVTTGQPAAGFGRNGAIDAYVGVVSEIVGESRRSTFTIPNPVTVYKNLIITGARPGESGPPGPRGDIRAFDARTGRLVWTFHVVPQPGDENFDPDGEWQDVTGGNVWSTMALDEENGLLFAPTGDHNTNSKGSQLYSSSIVALDAATGKLRWFRQITHRDIWDWDSPTPPTLIEADVDGRKVPAVIITGKHGLFFLFNRLTGEPLNGFTERPTPRSDDPANQEMVWPTQPFPDAPGPIARTQMTRAEVPDLVPGMRAYCQNFWDENQLVSKPLYAPRQSSQSAVITYPSPTGGPNWGGGSYNPELGLYYINLQNRAVYRPKAEPGSGTGEFVRRPPAEGPRPARPRGQRPPGFSFVTEDGLNLSCGALPWGELVAVDVKAKKVAWRTTLGMTEALGRQGLNTGAPNLGGSLATSSGLVFIGATNDRRFRAFDGKTGKQLWQAELETGAHATPISYMGADGRQYVVIAAGGGTTAGGPIMSDTLVAFRLP